MYISFQSDVSLTILYYEQALTVVAQYNIKLQEEFDREATQVIYNSFHLFSPISAFVG